VCCNKLEQKLTTALQELKLARKIIRILQEDLNTDLDTVGTKENVSNSNPHFKTVFTKERGRRLNNAQWKDTGAWQTQQFQPIPVMANRFAILENPQAEGMPYIINRQATDANETKNKQNHPPNINKRKVIILVDSHARGFAAEISRDLGTNFEVMGKVMPGARLEQRTKLAEKEAMELWKEHTKLW
jgi:hypothetical protein